MLQLEVSDQNKTSSSCLHLWTSNPGQENTNLLECWTFRGVNGHMKESTNVLRSVLRSSTSTNCVCKSLCCGAVSLSKFSTWLWKGHWSALLLSLNLQPFPFEHREMVVLDCAAFSSLGMSVQDRSVSRGASTNTQEKDCLPGNQCSSCLC